MDGLKFWNDIRPFTAPGCGLPSMTTTLKRDTTVVKSAPIDQRKLVLLHQDLALESSKVEHPKSHFKSKIRRKTPLTEQNMHPSF
jgi:hypothetical protein